MDLSYHPHHHFQIQVKALIRRRKLVRVARFSSRTHHFNLSSSCSRTRCCERSSQVICSASGASLGHRVIRGELRERKTHREEKAQAPDLQIGTASRPSKSHRWSFRVLPSKYLLGFAAASLVLLRKLSPRDLGTESLCKSHPRYSCVAGVTLHILPEMYLRVFWTRVVFRHWV